MDLKTTASNPKADEAASLRGVAVSLLLVTLHLATMLTILVEPQWLSSLNMRMDAIKSPSGYFHCFTGIFAYTSSVASNIWTMLFVAAFSLEAGIRYGFWRTLLFYAVSGAISCCLWGFGFALTDERVCLETPLQTSAAVTGLGAFLVMRDPSAKLRLLQPIPVFAWAGLLVFLTISAQFFWWEKWSVLLPAHLAAATFALIVDRLVFFSGRAGRHSGRQIEPIDRDFDLDDSDVADAGDEPFQPAQTLRDDSALDARLDEILAKISKMGSDSLSEEERELLLRASDKLRKRRK